MFRALIEVKCPNCNSLVTADEHYCNCIFGHCDNCHTDFEIDDNCQNVKESEK